MGQHHWTALIALAEEDLAWAGHHVQHIIGLFAIRIEASAQGDVSGKSDDGGNGGDEAIKASTQEVPTQEDGTVGSRGFYSPESL